MRRIRQQSLPALAACGLLALTNPTVAHSWVEQLMRIAPNGTMIGPTGYISGYVGRGPGFSDTFMTNLVPANGRPTGNAILATDKMCKSTQSIGNYSSQYPMLSAAPGDYVALRHQENGHVTLPQNQKNKPQNRGTIYIYGTTQPSDDDTLLGIHNVWTADGQGGDGRGALIATRDFDDGQCYQINGGSISQARQKQFPKEAQAPQGSDLWCQSDIQLPKDLDANGTYTLYWLWEWNTYADADTLASRDSTLSAAPPSAVVTLNETYTSCMQIAMVDPCSDELGSVKGPGCATEGHGSKHAVSFLQGQNLNNAAIEGQLQTPFLVDVPGSSSNSSSSGSGAAAPAAVSAPAPTAVDIVTVTVTEDVATVYVTDIVTVDESAAPTQTAAPTVAPFMKSARRRRAGEWQLGR